MAFDAFIGNRKIVERLRNKLHERRFPHGLIFAGPEGVGKRTFALMIAKALNCRVRGPEDFCGECSSCRRIDGGVHPDVIGVTIEEDATQIKIAQIRQLLSTLALHPLEGLRKVFIIDPANHLGEEAANALLKGLEEPPEDSYFILISSNVHELLMTIRSRCQTYNFAPLTFDEIRTYGVTDELVIRWSRGSIGRARTIDAAAIRKQREAILDFLETAAHADNDTLRNMLDASAELSKSRQDFSENLGVMALLTADLIYIAEGCVERMVNVDIRSRMEALTSASPTERWLRVAAFLRNVEASAKGNVNRQMLTDVLALSAAGRD